MIALKLLQNIGLIRPVLWDAKWDFIWVFKQRLYFHYSCLKKKLCIVSGLGLPFENLLLSVKIHDMYFQLNQFQFHIFSVLYSSVSLCLKTNIFAYGWCSSTVSSTVVFSLSSILCMEARPTAYQGSPNGRVKVLLSWVEDLTRVWRVPRESQRQSGLNGSF